MRINLKHQIARKRTMFDYTRCNNTTYFVFLFHLSCSKRCCVAKQGKVVICLIKIEEVGLRMQSKIKKSRNKHVRDNPKEDRMDEKRVEWKIRFTPRNQIVPHEFRSFATLFLLHTLAQSFFKNQTSIRSNSNSLFCGEQRWGWFLCYK